MNPQEKDKLQKSKQAKISIVLNIAALIVALIAIALLVNNIMYYKNTVSQYVAQGYSAADVMKQLIPSQLIPGIFDPVGLYGGIALALFGIGKVNKRISECMALLDRVDDHNDDSKEGILEENTTGTEAETDNKS